MTPKAYQLTQPYHPCGGQAAETSTDEFGRFYKVNVRGSLLCLHAITRVTRNQESRAIQGRNHPRDIGRGDIVELESCNLFVATTNIVQYNDGLYTF